MKCIIPGANVKVFGRAVHSLSKIGEELYLEALEHGLALRTVNSSRSAYACFIFAPSFFLHYSDGCDDIASDSSAEDILKYKINMKSCLTVFKSLSTLEKTVDRCQIKLDLKESRLVFQMYCRHGIVKTHNLAFIECETLQAVFSKDTSKNILTAQTRLLCEAVLNFQTTQEEVTLILDCLKTRLKNYVDEETDPQKVVHTELSLEPDEFESYTVGADCQVTFCLKELRAILAFSEPANLPISIYFDSPGKPIVFTMDTDPGFEANFVLATLADKSSSVSSSQLASQERPSQRISNMTHSNGDSLMSRKVPPRKEEPKKGTEKLKNRSRVENRNESAASSKQFSTSDNNNSTGFSTSENNKSSRFSTSDNNKSSRFSTSDSKSSRFSTSDNNNRNQFSKNDNNNSRFSPTDNKNSSKFSTGANTSKRPIRESSAMSENGDVTFGSTNHREKLLLSSDVTGQADDDTRPGRDARVRGCDVSGYKTNLKRHGSDVTGSTADVTVEERERPRPCASWFGGQEKEDDDQDDDVLCSPIIPNMTSRLKEKSMSVSRLIIPDDDSTTDDEAANDFIPGTPPSKKFKSIFMGLSQSTTSGSQVSQRVILAADTDDEDD